MFHILIANSTPNHLCGGPWSGLNNTGSDVQASTVECGKRGGQIREAISQTDFNQLVNSKKLNYERACKACMRKIGGKYYGKTKDSEAGQGTGADD